MFFLNALHDLNLWIIYEVQGLDDKVNEVDALQSQPCPFLPAPDLLLFVKSSQSLRYPQQTQP